MATFRIHLSSERNQNPVTNLITGIAEVRDAEGTTSALDLLHALKDEIAFVTRFILTAEQNHPAYVPAETATGTTLHP